MLPREAYLVVFVACIFAALPSCLGGSDKILMCYYASWAIYRANDGNFRTNYIPPDLCTHLVYAFQGFNETTNDLYSRDHWGDFEVDGIGQIVQTVGLKKKNPKLKVLFSVGGWSEGSVKFSHMAASREARTAFVNNVISFIQRHNFDGIDFAWEYPNMRGGVSEDKDNFVQLLREIKSKLKSQGKEYLLGLQMFGRRNVLALSYDIREIAATVDYISLVAYQYHNPGEKYTGHNAPLKDSTDFNVEYSLNFVLNSGVPPGKVLLGFATYGHPFTLNEPVTDGEYFPVEADTTFAGPWSNEAGFIGFNEVCYWLTNTPLWSEKWDSKTLTPFAVNKKKQLLSYDNQQSYREKLKLVSSKNLGGAMVWSIDTDDFSGTCYGKKFPLISEIKEYLQKIAGQTDHGGEFQVSEITVAVIDFGQG